MSYITQRTERCGGFVLNNTKKSAPTRTTRTEGRIKRLDSCLDTRAWNPCPDVRSVYLLDYVNASRCFSEANICANITQANKTVATYTDVGINVNLGTEKNIGTRNIILADKTIGTPKDTRTFQDKQTENKIGKNNKIPCYKSATVCTDGWQSVGSGASKKICVGLKTCKASGTCSAVKSSKPSGTRNDVATLMNARPPCMDVKPCMDVRPFLDVKPTITASEPGRECISKTVCTTKNQRVSNKSYINDLECRFDAALKENLFLRKKMAGYRRKLRKQCTKKTSYDDKCNLNVPSEFNRLQERLLTRRLTSKEKIETYEQQLNILKSHCKLLQSHKLKSKSRRGNDSFTSASMSSLSGVTESTRDEGSLHRIIAELQIQVSSLRPVKKERDDLQNAAKRLNDKIKNIDSHYNAELDSLLTVLSSTQSENESLSEENSLTKSSISTLCEERDFLLRKIHQCQCQEIESDESENDLSCQVKNLSEQRDMYKSRLEELQELYHIRGEQLRNAECTILDQMKTIKSLTMALKGTSTEKNIVGRHSDVYHSKSEGANLKSTSNQESTKSLPIKSIKNKINNGHSKEDANNKEKYNEDQMKTGAPDTVDIISETITRENETSGSRAVQQNDKNQNQINDEQAEIKRDLSVQNETGATSVSVQVQVKNGTLATQTKIDTENNCTEMRLCQMDHVKTTLLRSKSAVSALIKHMKEENDEKRKTSTQLCKCSDKPSID